MREIKFRIYTDLYDDEKERMMYKDVSWDSEDGFAFAGGGYGVDFMKEDEPECIYEVMQFTGLIDKNGKEIFEGDIVKYSGNSRIWEIYFDTENLQFRMKSTDKSAKIETVHKYAFHELGTIEIIGNIWENPELLS